MKASVCSALLIACLAQPLAAQFPLSIEVTVAAPYPVRLADFTSAENNIFVRIDNPTQATYSVYLTGVLRNEDSGATISTDPNGGAGDCFDVMPGGRSITGIDLVNLFDANRLVFTGTSLDVIRGNRALPEGRYSLCLRAKDCNDPVKFLSPLPTETGGCASFDISYVDPPEIMLPECGAAIDIHGSGIHITWSFIPPSGGMGNIQFRLQMIELDPPDRRPAEAFLSSPLLLDKDGIQTTSYNLMPDDPPTLEDGKSYAFRIVAYDDQQRVQFRNNGISEPCYFPYGRSTGTSERPLITTEYPVDNDIIPFRAFPLILKFDPYDNNYHGFTYTAVIESPAGHFDHQYRVLRWPAGPLASQRAATGFAEMTQEQSQYIAVNKNLSELPPTYVRGTDYTWYTNIDMTLGSTMVTIPQIETHYSVGMGPSLPLRPENGDTVAPGDITMKWKSANEPRKLLPDLNIVQATGGSGPTSFFNGNVLERWRLEISRTERFDSVLLQRTGIIGTDIDMMLPRDAIVSALYKEIDEDINLTDPGRYYWRVKWMTYPGSPSDNRSYATSEVFSFVISPTGGGGSTPRRDIAGADTTGGCRSVCDAPAITNRTASSGLAVGETLRIGKFVLEVRTITSSAGNQFTGTGIVEVSFLNHVKIQVDFTSIQYNSDRQIFAGTVRAAEDRGFASEEVSTTIGTVISMAGPELAALNGFLADGERLVSFFTGAREIGMPIGIDREIDGNRYTVGIIAMEFTPVKASINAVMSLDIPQIGDQLIAFGVKDLCITPAGLGDAGRLYLARDLVIVQDGDTRFAFKGAASADTTASCYVSWDCRGFLCARVEAAVTFPRTMLLPDQDDGTAGAGTVTATFSLSACRGGNFMARLNIDPFQIAGVDGWGWVASNAWLDLSDLDNPPGFTLPEHYGDTTLLRGGSRMINTWQGFYMETLQVRAPAQFQNTSTTSRIAFGIHNTIIDATGLTTSIRVTNVLPLSQGSFQGWGISLDTINIDFVSNTFREGGIGGKLAIPIFESGQALDYHMALTYSDRKLNYLCRVFARDTLTVPMWIAKMHLRPDSEIRIQVGDSTFASTNLSGDISITGTGDGGGGMSIPGLNFTGMVFEGFKLSTSEPHFAIDSLYFSHASPQKSVAGFPVNVNDINLNISDITRPGIDFDLQIVLGDFGAEFGFNIYAQLDFTGGRFSAGFGGIRLRSITIDQTISGIQLRGGLEFYNSDPVFGDGVRGFLDVTLPMKLQARLTAQFGTKKTSPTARFDTPDNYAYWFIDGLVNFPGGVPIFSGFGIYGFGGGAYHHMRINTATLPTAAAALAGSGTPGSGARTSVAYIPDFSTFLGMKLTAVLGTHPSSDTFNMDVTLAAEFNSHGGLNYIGISGQGYVMAAITERSSAKIWADIDIRYSVPPTGNENLSGNFNVYVNVNDILVGAATGYRFVNSSFYVDKDMWYFYVGTLADRGGLRLNLGGVVNAELLTYLMVGHGIPTTLPPPPDRILSLLYGGGEGRLGSEGAVASQLDSRSRDADQSRYQSGRGFAMGVYFNLEAHMDFAIFYADLQLMLGFDINVTQDDHRVCAETGMAPGINNWYATGQIYAGLWGDMGVKVDLWFVHGRFSFINLAAAMMMRGGLPNPEWFTGRAALHYSVLNGLVEGSCSFEVNAGQKCSIVNADPFAGVEFIADIRPQAEDNPVNVFQHPTVSFNLPVDRIIEFPSPTDTDPTLTRRFRPFISSFQLVLNNGTNAVVPGTYELTERNTIATYKFVEALEPTTDYKIIVVVQADEYFRDGSVRRVNTGGSVWEERREITYRTGERPDNLDPSVIVYSYPIENQRFFLKGENTKGPNGLIRLSTGQSYLFYATKDNYTYAYVARLKPLGAGDPVDVPVVNHGLYIDFTLPPMENDKMYALQIIRKRTGGSGPVMISPRFAGISSRTVAQALVPLRFDLGGSSVNINRQGQMLPGATVNAGEHLLHSLYFKTSRFSTLAEKLATSEFSATYQNIFIAELFDLKTVVPELFDEYDINGVYKDGIQVLKPLVGVTAPFTYTYHTGRANPLIYEFVPRLRTFMTGAPGYGAPAVTTLDRHGKGNPPVNSVSFGPGRVEPPLDIEEIERAAGIVRQAGVSYAVSSSMLALTRMMSHGALTAGAGGYGVSSFATLAPADPSNFRLFYETSNYVLQDFTTLKNNISRILSTTFLGIPVYENAMATGDPALLAACNSLLARPGSDFLLSNGDYGIDLFYRAPTSVGNINSRGITTTKTFRYGIAPVIPSGGLIRRRGW